MSKTIIGGDLFDEDHRHVFDSDGTLIGIAQMINGEWFAVSANGKTKIHCGCQQSAIDKLRAQADMTDKKVEKLNTNQMSLF